MNFTKHKVTERQMLSEMLDYVGKILNHKRKNDEQYRNFSCCISTRTNGVEILSKEYKENERRLEEKIIIVIRYDERNDFYYFVEHKKIGSRTLENRIIIKDKDDFYVYMEDAISREIVVLQK